MSDLYAPDVEVIAKPNRSKKTKSRNGSVQATAEELILAGGHTYETLLAAVKLHHPSAKTNCNCMRWYVANLKKNGFAFQAIKSK